jgi:hypothetical protein
LRKFGKCVLQIRGWHRPCPYPPGSGKFEQHGKKTTFKRGGFLFYYIPPKAKHDAQQLKRSKNPAFCQESMIQERDTGNFPANPKLTELNFDLEGIRSFFAT